MANELYGKEKGQIRNRYDLVGHDITCVEPECDVLVQHGLVRGETLIALLVAKGWRVDERISRWRCPKHVVPEAIGDPDGYMTT